MRAGGKGCPVGAPSLPAAGGAVESKAMVDMAYRGGGCHRRSNMPLLLFAAFLAVPLAEVYLFAELGAVLGAPATVALCLATAAAGAFLVRRQGRAVLASARQALRAGRVPAAEAFDGVCLVVAGIALLLPGFLTDVAGFLLLAPPLRRLLFALLALRLAGRLSGDGTTIEGRWEAESPPAAPRLDRRLPDR